MARKPRIEFPGAVYHCTARAAPGRNLTTDDEDRHIVEDLLAEAVGRTGWIVYAWVQFEDHYHIALKTPDLNLVRGMKYFQNVWSKRINARHGVGRSLFSGRYRSVIVQEDGHLSALIDHIHLNPFRRSLGGGNQLPEDYPWCSLRDYLVGSQDRRPWIAVNEGLLHMGYDGEDELMREHYRKHLERIACERAGLPPLPQSGGRSLHSTIRRGWVLGTVAFRDELSARGTAPPASGITPGSHGEWFAERLLDRGLRIADLSVGDLDRIPKSDWRKRAIGRAIRARTTVPTRWIAHHLRMGAGSHVANLVLRDPDPSWGCRWLDATAIVQELMKIGIE